MGGILNELFTIGQTSKIFDVSVQTLRYYSKVGILMPHFVNPQNGYRYYSYEQFHIIDRIKYLRHLGLSIDEIRTIYSTPQTTDELKKDLDAQSKRLSSEINRLQKLAREVNRYKNYFSFQGNNDIGYVPYSLHKNERRLLCVSCKNKTREQYHIDLLKLRHSAPYKGLEVFRQFVLILDINDLKKNIITPLKIGFFITDECSLKSSPNILQLPANDFICFQGKILTDDWCSDFAIKIAEKLGICGAAIACEYENSLLEYKKCVYEVEIPVDLRGSEMQSAGLNKS